MPGQTVSEIASQLTTAKRRLDDLWDAYPDQRNEIYDKIVRIDSEIETLISNTIDEKSKAYQAVLSQLKTANQELDAARTNIRNFANAMSLIAKVADTISSIVTKA